MTRLLLAVFGLLALITHVPAQEKKDDDRVKVEVFLATDHLPKDLKAGNRVDLTIITSKVVGPQGVAVYSGILVAADVEVASVEQVEKPATPDAAVRVHLLIAKDKSEKVEQARDRKVAVIEGKERKFKPVTLRLELSKTEKR